MFTITPTASEAAYTRIAALHFRSIGVFVKAAMPASLACGASIVGNIAPQT